MRALILNSGMGTRMGEMTLNHPKCMTEIGNGDTILSRQLRLLSDFEVKDVVITTGPFENLLKRYCLNLGLSMSYTFVHNDLYKETNYIYSIYCARDYLVNNDILMMHGDLVFESEVLRGILNEKKSVMAISSKLPIPQKDFKAVIKEGKIKAVGVEFFEDSVAAQALYKIDSEEWNKWLKKVIDYCESGLGEKRNCYAEVAFNEISDKCSIFPYDFEDKLCNEIDNLDDLEFIKKKISSMLS